MADRGGKYATGVARAARWAGIGGSARQTAYRDGLGAPRQGYQIRSRLLSQEKRPAETHSGEQRERTPAAAIAGWENTYVCLARRATILSQPYVRKLTV